MSLCAYCGMQLVGADDLCPRHHLDPPDDGWAVANRVMCDLLHRGIGAARPRASDRDVRFSDDAEPYASVSTETSAAA